MLNIFDDNAFGLVSLTTGVNAIPAVPGRLAQLGLFDVERISTTGVSVERNADVLRVVPPSPRGGPGVTADQGKRDIRVFQVPHFEIDDAVMAEEVQNVRAFGEVSTLQTIVDKVSAKLAIHARSMDATEELARIGAVKGLITYADGSTLNLFTEFQTTAETEVDFDLDNASPVDGILRRRCQAIIRNMAIQLGNVPFTRVHAFCGDAFFDDLLQHREVRDTYKNWSEAQILRDSYLGEDKSTIFGSFMFGGIVFENYRGQVGTTSYIDTNTCHFVPVGVPGLFKSIYAPGDYEETVNTLGQRLYARQYPMQNGKGRHLEVQMNALQLCTRPKALLQARRT